MRNEKTGKELKQRLIDNIRRLEKLERLYEENKKTSYELKHSSGDSVRETPDYPD